MFTFLGCSKKVKAENKEFFYFYTMNSHQSHIFLSQTLHLENMDEMPLRLLELQTRSNTCAQIESGNVTLPEPILPKVEELRYTSINNFESDMYFYHSDLPIAIA